MPIYNNLTPLPPAKKDSYHPHYVHENKQTNTPHGKYLVGKYTGQPGIRFVGGIYDFKKLNSVV